MTSIHITYKKTSFGELILGDFEGKLCLCDWRYRKQREQIDQRIKNGLQAEFKQGNTALLEQTTQQLDRYFSRELVAFELPLLLVGTPFQKSVWQALQEIPYGTTISYQKLALKLGNLKAIRAVAAANGANALALFIPCHRVIGSNGELTGYAGGLSAKKKMIALEKAIPSKQLDLFTFE